MEPPVILVVHNEIDEAYDYHSVALAGHFPGCLECDYPGGERPDLDGVDGVVLSGSTAGVYEVDDEPWIAEQEALVRELVDREIPTLGICFGHQIANAALGGRVEHVGTTHRLVAVELADESLFDGVERVVPAIHGDVVTEPGDGMVGVASTEYAPYFGTKHETAPLWTVQFHPEFTTDFHEEVEADFGWTETEHTYADVTAHRLFENFLEVVRRGIDG